MKIGFLFPGQGSQSIGMGKDIYEKYESAKRIYNSVEEITGINIANISFEGSEETLNETKNTQLAILTMSLAILEILKENDITCEIAAGLSLGEYSALINSEVISFEEGIKLVQKRGEFMQELLPKGDWQMAAILGMTEEQVVEVCKKVNSGYVVPANYNSVGQIAISGEKEAVLEAEQIAKEMGAKKVMILKTAGPFHTEKLMDASNALRKELENITINKFKSKVIKNIDGEEYNDTENIKDILAKHGYNSAPKTFDELYEICEKIKGELRIGQYSLGLPATPSDLAWATWGLQQNLTGGLIVSDDWLNSRANEPGYKELAKFFYTCSVNKYANTGNITSDGYSNLAEALFDGNVMMCWGGSWQIALFYTLAEDSGDYSMIDKIGVAPIPTLTGDTNLTTATNGGWAYAISSTAKGEKKAAAVKFIDWLFVKNPEILGDYFVRSKMSRTSASKKVQEYLKTVEVDVDSEWVEVVKNVSDKAIAEAYYPWDLSYQVSNMLQYFTQTTDKTYNIDSFNAKYATVVKKINYDIEQIMSRQSYTGNPWYEEE